MSHPYNTAAMHPNPMRLPQHPTIPVKTSPNLPTHLEVGLATELLILNDLNPVAIRVQQERDVLHPPVGQPLLPAALQVLEALARRVEVIHRDACHPSAKAQRYHLPSRL